MDTDYEIDEVVIQEIVPLISTWMPSAETLAAQFNWCGSCIGDDATTKRLRALRTVAFQTAGKTSDVWTWVKQMSRHLQTPGAHIEFSLTQGYITTTSNNSGQHFFEYGILAISHNTAQIMKTETTRQTL